MTPAELSRTVLRTVRRAVEAGELCAAVPERAVVRRPPPHRRDQGDYATGIALQLAKEADRPPRQIAELLRERIARTPGIARVDIADPGFLNITLDHASGTDLVREVLGAERYGQTDEYAHQHLELTFPRDTRAAVTADALARILRSQGAPRVTLRCEGGPPDPTWYDLGVRNVTPAPLDAPSAVSSTTSPSAAPSISASSTTAPLDAPPAAGPKAVPAAASPETCAATPAASAATPAATAPGANGDPAPNTIALRPVPAGQPAVELLRTLGPDAARWALLRPAGHDRARTEPAQLLAQRESNPLFRVRYAHARAHALLRNAAQLGVDPRPGDTPEASAEALRAVLAEYPAVLATAARLRAPDRVARHLEATADAFFRFHDHCPVLPRGDEKPEAAHRARVALAQAAGTVLAGGLHLLGITAPARL
ncbi:ArgS-related anticodon-binding protein NrtL [Streptomyces pathocidini]|uniref:arginine--tRNA ligase n=1 Tax=Streptomyces pathocidini TaxID=1650571 RepID=A0ABW7UME5_9ACTN